MLALAGASVVGASVATGGSGWLGFVTMGVAVKAMVAGGWVGAGTAGFATRIVAAGFGTTSLGATGFGTTSLGATGLGATGFGTIGLGTTGIGAGIVAGAGFATGSGKVAEGVGGIVGVRVIGDNSVEFVVIGTTVVAVVVVVVAVVIGIKAIGDTFVLEGATLGASVSLPFPLLEQPLSSERPLIHSNVLARRS